MCGRDFPHSLRSGVVFAAKSGVIVSLDYPLYYRRIHLSGVCFLFLPGTAPALLKTLDDPAARPRKLSSSFSLLFSVCATPLAFYAVQEIVKKRHR